MKKRVCFIVSAEITVKAFLIDHIRLMRKGYEVALIVNTKDPDLLKSLLDGLSVIPIGIERRINIIKDIAALYALYVHFCKNKYDLVHSFTPKAGLLSMISAKMAGIPIRIHTFTGQVWANKGGIRRFYLKNIDRLLALCATNVLVDSFSQRDFVVKENVVPEHKAGVIANGSICGVDTQRFKSDLTAHREIRKKHAIPESDIVFLFLGRLTVDKGILDLALAFIEVNKRYFNSHLMIVGPDEERMKERVTEICKECSDNVHFEYYTDAPERYMAASDVFCLPSYREGFGMTIIEAASVGIPAIGSRIYGITDAVEEDVTGFLHDAGNIKELTTKMLIMIERPDMRNKMGKQSHERVLQSYSKELVTSALVNYYDTLFTLK